MTAKQIYPKPCVYCGACCQAEICHQGMQFLSTVSPPCPALEKRDGRYCCGLIANTSRYVYPGALSEELYGKIRQSLIELFEFGVGCDSRLRCPDAAVPASPEKS
jgi:hypothetical protein